MKKRNSKRGGTLVAFAMLSCLGWYAIGQADAHHGGITGQTQKTTDAGCSCHCSSQQPSTTVALACSNGSSPLTTAPNTTYNFTITVSSTDNSENDAGCDIASYSGNGLSAGTGLYASNGELTHSSPKAFSSHSTSWNFTYTTGSTSSWDTIYATGNAVNGDGYDNGDCTDKWNWAPKFIIHTVVPPVRMALSRTSISLGSVRVGSRKADSLKVTSTGVNAITISSSSMKSGLPFSSYPTSSNRTLNPGSTEIDSVIVSPTARGSFSDSLIFSTNSDTVPEQRMGLAVSGQGIQAVFNPTNGSSVAFGNLHVGRTSQRTYSFSNSGDDTLFLQTPSIAGSGFTISTNISTLVYPPNASGSVTVQFAPTAAQSYSGTLTFTASNGVSAPSVGISGTGILPQIQIASSANVGSVRIGQPLAGTITFKNIGTDTLHVSNASITQASNKFSLSSYDQTILPNANGSVHIIYTPTAEQTDTGTLHFKSDDPTDSNVAVAISGTGTAPHMSVPLAGDTVNFGPVKINSSSSMNVSVRNSGSADLNVTSVAAGPAPFNVVSGLSTVPAGSTGNIVAGFSPTSVGPFAGKLVIHGDDANNATDTVFLAGMGVNSALTVSPGNINFGSIPVLASVTDTITLRDSGSANVNVYSVQVSPLPGPFAIVGSTPTQVIEGGSAIIVVGFAPTAAGNYSGSVVISTDDNNAPTRTVNLIGTGISDPFTVQPAVGNFGQVPILTSVKDTFVMKNTGNIPVAISRYQLSSGLAFSIADSIAHTVPANDSAIVVVNFDPTTSSNYTSTLTITTNDISSPIHTVSLSGTGIKGSLTVNPFPVNFGYVLLNHDSSQHLELRNAGQASVTINASSITGPNSSAFGDGGFSTPVTLGAGDSLSMTMSFTPTLAQSYTDTLHFTLVDGTTMDVPLSGNGVNSGVAKTGMLPIRLLLSPNPAGTLVNLFATLPEPVNCSIDVFDAAGRNFIHSELGTLSEGEHTIPLATNSLTDGTYFLRLSTSSGQATEMKLVVQKQ